MAREKFSQRELEEVVGSYPPLRNSTVPEKKFYRPITPLENFSLFFQGKTPYWIPRISSYGVSDVQLFRHRIHPDNVVGHLIADGEPPMEYSSNVMRSSWFDLDWEFVESVGGATVHPGNPKVPDISRWEDFVSIPDHNTLDWESCEKNNKEYLSTDKMKELSIPSGFWERLISLCDVDKAAMALIDDDTKPGVHRLFDKLADMHIEYISRMKKICNINAVLIHDDWGHQNASFFSLNTAREMLVPYLKRVIDHCHSLGLYYEQHSCGKCELLIPAWVEAGVDVWCGQPMNNFDMLLEKHAQDTIAFGIKEPDMPENPSEQQLRELAHAWVEKYQNKRAVQAFAATTPVGFSTAIYEFSRKAYENAE